MDELTNIIIENENGIKFGGYIENIIENVNQRQEDENTFLFSRNFNVAVKYEMKENRTNEISFRLFENWSEKLFAFGNNQYVLTKRKITETNIDENAIFDMKKLEKEFEFDVTSILFFDL